MLNVRFLTHGHIHMVRNTQYSHFTEFTKWALLAWNAYTSASVSVFISPHIPSCHPRKKVVELSKTRLEGVSKASRRLAEAWGGYIKSNIASLVSITIPLSFYFNFDNPLIETIPEIWNLVKKSENEGESSFVIITHVIFLPYVQTIVPFFHLFCIK